jgi:hypothetical protein
MALKSHTIQRLTPTVYNKDSEERIEFQGFPIAAFTFHQ